MSPCWYKIERILEHLHRASEKHIYYYRTSLNVLVKEGFLMILSCSEHLECSELRMTLQTKKLYLCLNSQFARKRNREAVTLHERVSLLPSAKHSFHSTAPARLQSKHMNCKTRTKREGKSFADEKKRDGKRLRRCYMLQSGKIRQTRQTSKTLEQRFCEVQICASEGAIPVEW